MQKKGGRGGRNGVVHELNAKLSSKPQIKSFCQSFVWTHRKLWKNICNKNIEKHLKLN